MRYNRITLKEGVVKMAITAEKKQILQVRVSPSEKETIKKLAEEAHLSISSYVRSQLLTAK